MPTNGDGALASLDWSDEERKKLAKLSISWKCDKCGSHNLTALPPEDKDEQMNTSEILELASNLRLKNKDEQLRDEKQAEQDKQKVKQNVAVTTPTDTPKEQPTIGIENTMNPLNPVTQESPIHPNTNTQPIPQTEIIPAPPQVILQQPVTTSTHHLDRFIGALVVLIVAILLRKLGYISI